MSAFNEFELIEIHFDELSGVSFPKDKKVKLNINKDGFLFEFLMYFKSNSKKVLVLGSGAYDSNKMKPPIFNRYKWIESFEESSILYNDPTLYLGNANIGWGYGTKDKHFIKDIGEILKVIYKNNDIQPSKALYFGSSAGGFTSLMLASYVRGWAFVNNPQTDIENYVPKSVISLKEIVYDDPNKKLDVQKSNVVEWFKVNGFIPRIYYAQNLACSHDMENHYLPFLDQLRNLDSELFNGRMTSYLYSDEEKGHNPMDKKETLGTIKNIFRLIK